MPATVNQFALVGVARIRLAFHIDKPWTSAQLSMLGDDKSAVDAVAAARTSPFCFGPWCWILEDVKALVKPVPCAGALGLWKIAPELEAQMMVAT